MNNPIKSLWAAVIVWWNRPLPPSRRPPGSGHQPHSNAPGAGPGPYPPSPPKHWPSSGKIYKKETYTTSIATWNTRRKTMQDLYELLTIAQNTERKRIETQIAANDAEGIYHGLKSQASTASSDAYQARKALGDAICQNVSQDLGLELKEKDDA